MIKKIISAAMAVTFLTSLSACKDKEEVKISPLVNTYKTLSNGNKIPTLGFGTFKLPDNNTGYKAVLSAIENGYRHIDTAYVYNNQKSVGKAIKDSGVKREDLFVTSKISRYSKTYEEAMKNFEETMQQLNMDYVDLLLIHWPVVKPKQEDGAKYFAANLEVWRAMEEIYRSGRAKAIGLSNFDIPDVKNIMNNAQIKPMLNQIKIHIGFYPEELIEFCLANDIVVEGYETLGRGYVLKDKTVQNMAKKYNATPAQLAISYSIQKGVVPLVMAEHSNHQRENLESNVTISEEDMKVLDDLLIASPHF